MSKVLCVAAASQELDWYCATLERGGHSVDAAASARDALRALESKQRYDLVVTSWVLGSDTAGKVVDTVKQLGLVPVMVVSNFVEKAFQEADAKVDLYVEKPTSAREFLEFVHILLTAATSEEARSKVAAARAK